MANGRTGLVIRPVQNALGRLGTLYQRPPDTIRDVNLDSWWSPLQPVKPFGPPGTEPRGFQTWAGQNLIWTPRADAEYSAADLKLLANYPLARTCIENVKDSVTRAPWEIQARPQPGETHQQAAKRSKNDDNILKLNRFFEYPDREHNWQEWLRPLLDDLLVIDAPSVLIRQTYKGDVAELAVIRGEMITRYIDENGFTPAPPAPAYAQNWWGLPLVNLTTDQLIYKPRNIAPRNSLSSQLYGMSPTEQIAKEIEIGIRRLEFVYSYYTEGSVPGVVQVVPRGTSPDRIEEAMSWMNSQLAGNLAARNQWRIVQGFNEPGKPDQIIFSKEPLLAGLYDEKHIRQIAFGYGTSPQRLIRMIRTEGRGATENATIEGTLPWIMWVKGYIDFIIQKKFGLIDYEMAIDPYAEPDPLKNAAALTMLVGKGVMTPNEARKRVNEELRPEPEADRLGIITGTGFVPLSIPSVQAGVSVDDKGQPGPHPLTANLPVPPAPMPKDHNAARGGTPVSQEAGGGRSTGRNSGTPNGKESLDGEKVEKREGSRIEPDALTPESHQAVHSLDHSLRQTFQKQLRLALDETDRHFEKAATTTLRKRLARAEAATMTLEEAFVKGIAPLFKAAEVSNRTLYLMRHGRTALDPVKRSDGWLDFPLSDDGRVRLITAQQYLKDVLLSGIYCSTLKRHVETAEIMSSGNISHPPIIQDDRAKTWNLGVLSGQQKAPNKKKVAWLMKHPEEAPEGGESLLQFRERFSAFLNELKMKAANGLGPILGVLSGSNLRELSIEMFGDRGTLDLDEGGLLMMVPVGRENEWKVNLIFGHKDAEEQMLS